MDIDLNSDLNTAPRHEPIKQTLTDLEDPDKTIIKADTIQ